MLPTIDCDVIAGFWPRAKVPMDPRAVSAALARHGIGEACVVSARAALFDFVAGNREALRWAEESEGSAVRFRPVGSVDLRRYLGYRGEIRELCRRGVGLWRLFPEYQGWDWDHPGFRKVADALEEEGATLFVKGRPGGIVKALEGSKVRLVIGAHFYDLAEALALWEDGRDFWLSTGLLHGPGSIDLVAERAGAERLVFGSGTPLAATGSAVAVLGASGLAEDAKRKVLRGNLDSLIGRGGRS